MGTVASGRDGYDLHAEGAWSSESVVFLLARSLARLLVDSVAYVHVRSASM